MAEKYAGVDISVWQTNVDYKALASGNILDVPISFAIIRLGYSQSLDKRAMTHINGCLKEGLKVGLYLYSCAKTPEVAKAEATWALKTIHNLGLDGKIELPIAFDMEEPDVLALGKAKCTEIAKAFMDTIAAGNYMPMLYTSAAMYKNCLNSSELENYILWVAGYISESTLRNTYKVTNYAIWQHSVAKHESYDIQKVGSVPGVSGQCDCDWMYRDLASEVKAAGKNGFSVEKNYTVTVGTFKTKDETEKFCDEMAALGRETTITEIDVPVEAPAETPVVRKTVDELAAEVWRGLWGAGSERKRRLTEAGYDYVEVQKRVNAMAK